MHQTSIQGPPVDQSVYAAQRVQQLWLVANPIEVAALTRGESGVETLRCNRDAVDHHIRWQHAIEPGKG
jgi:hypothetical protein